MSHAGTRVGRGRPLARAVATRIGRTLLSVVASTAVIVGLWYALIEAFELNRLVAKDPQAVWQYLFSEPDAAENRDLILDGLWHTLSDAALGYTAGTAAALGVAIAFVLSRPVEQALMPVAMMLRSVPLVAMTPLLILVFGRGPLAVSVVTGIVVFFPSLVNLVVGLRSAPAAAADLVIAHGGGPFTVLRRVALPSALPALFVSARTSVPGAVVGALLAEWLATSAGLGHLMQRAQQTFDYGGVWASVVVIIAASVVIYAVVGLLEAIVLVRYGPAPSRRG
ncbi:ABC transporter permease [Parafrankia colletiae]|uniref:ABC transporter permease n=2 Tax=Parafrankia colletiae TaxID=573497 RepID=A0A1S1QEZ2_9ACTN|nr:ABC transporter permease subunit [Frankia sp. Cpl3]OHV32031.1 ABC transporter permease [Parafrankia colletiae]